MPQLVNVFATKTENLQSISRILTVEEKPTSTNCDLTFLSTTVHISPQIKNKYSKFQIEACYYQYRYSESRFKFQLLGRELIFQKILDTLLSPYPSPYQPAKSPLKQTGLELKTQQRMTLNFSAASTSEITGFQQCWRWNLQLCDSVQAEQALYQLSYISRSIDFLFQKASTTTTFYISLQKRHKGCQV